MDTQRCQNPEPVRLLVPLLEFNRPHQTRTFSPLAEMLPEHTSPELLFLETKWASLMSYGMTSKLLQDVLPIDFCHSAPMEPQAFGFRLRANAPEGQKQFPC